MTNALNIFGALLAFAAIGSAISKLMKVPDVMAAMAKVGVKPNQIPMLAYLEIAGGLGIIVGCFVGVDDALAVDSVWFGAGDYVVYALLVSF